MQLLNDLASSFILFSLIFFSLFCFLLIFWLVLFSETSNSFRMRWLQITKSDHNESFSTNYSQMLGLPFPRGNWSSGERRGQAQSQAFFQGDTTIMATLPSISQKWHCSASHLLPSPLLIRS